LDELSKAKGCTKAQIALTWVLSQGEDLVPIPGTKRRTYLEENVKAVDITLTGAEITQLSNAIPLGAASGQRYAPQAMISVNR
jgi:aryl-alcohol dehydrogenase-like predicted oxidoreductase